MKRLLCLLLALALLAGCTGSGTNEKESGVRFYYRSADGDYFSEQGAMGFERRNLDENQADVDAMMALYLKGPLSPELTSPFPSGMRLVRSEMTSSEITLTFDDSLAALTGIGLRLACACIAKTVWEYSGCDTVTIRAQTLELDGKESIVIHPDKLVLKDHSAGQPNALVRLYFADTQNRYLIEEQRSTAIDDEDGLPDYIVRSLIAGPQSESLRPTIPKGTMLLNVSVVDRVCLVNFSAEFLQNRPRNVLAERMTVFSVVNSLSQLDEVDSVEILAEGSSIGRYYAMDLSGELLADEDMIGPVRTGVGESDATLYLIQGSEEHLSAFPMRVQDTVDQSRAVAVMQALCGFTPRNGYSSPAQSHVELQNVQLRLDGTLHVEYNVTQPFKGADHTVMLRSIIATALAVPEVQKIEIMEDGEPLDLSSGAWTVNGKWFLDPQE